jgi:phosphoglycerate dehydrogenase-like enzyme
MHKTVYTTERGAFHQQRALSGAPKELAITMLRQPDRETLRAALADAEYLISERVGVIDAEIIASAPQLKLILRMGSLSHDIDVDAARAAGVIVCRYPDPGTIAVAEHILMQTLVLIKNLREVERVALEAQPIWGESKKVDEDTFAYNWSGREGIGSLNGATVGILGMGEIGAEVARRLVGWDCAVVYNKRRRLPEHVERELHIAYADESTLLANSDVLVCLLPYLPETVYFVNAERIAQMKTGALVVSCGSGGTLDEAALAAAITAGKLGGVAIDSHDWEPLSEAHAPLLSLARQGANVLLTPHTAAGGGGARVDDQNRAREYENIRRHLAGQPVLYRLDG